MQNGNYKLKLNSNQLIVMHGTITGSAMCVGRFKTMEEKLLSVNLISIAKKINAKWFMPSAITRLTLTPSEAIAFWLIFNGTDYSNEYQMAVMRNILDEIHKKFI